VSEIKVYTTPFCPFCYRVKALLDSKDIKYNEIDVMMSPQLRKEMTSKAGSHTVPQVFVGDMHIGDCDELHALEAKGRLDGLLQSA